MVAKQAFLPASRQLQTVPSLLEVASVVGGVGVGGVEEQTQGRGAEEDEDQDNLACFPAR